MYGLIIISIEAKDHPEQEDPLSTEDDTSDIHRDSVCVEMDGYNKI